MVFVYYFIHHIELFDSTNAEDTINYLKNGGKLLKIHFFYNKKIYKHSNFV